MKNYQLYSAGIDSFIGYHYLKSKGLDIVPIYIDLKHRYAKWELLYIQKYRPETQILHNVLNLSEVEDKSAHIPYRNLFLTMLVAAYNYWSNDLYVNIFINGVADDRVSDQGEKFLEQINLILNYHSELVKFNVVNTFDKGLTKLDIVEWYITNIGSLKDLDEKTFSCYNPNEDGSPCMACKACFRKYAVLAWFDYFKPFKNKAILQSYKENISNYEPKRQKVIEKYLKLNEVKL
jgi:7-cyano-7-deazaguanine synthase in queuosine biosynthesis